MSTSRIKAKLKEFMGIKDSPMKVAVSFGIGTLIAFSPWVGLHTVLVIILAMAFKLNKVAILTAAYINNPFTVVPISTFCIWVGMKLMGMEAANITIDFSNLTLSNVMGVFGVLLMPFIWGSLFVSVIAAVLSFFIVLHIFRLKRRMRETTPVDILNPADYVDELPPVDCVVEDKLTVGDDGGGN
ncbi:MAG: DUF2062 domain-containing protein [Candidatus Magnetobacterium sp. LHC-1]|uniref:DUF2062 domain-containing protein n=1 Tax=Candidatus Magnetobacterium casense TaxID=1455061 RepID=A0ABS6S1K6_9BACT|nr:DUF2062 domain-containing protein [Candidatus Magnetobacterium casensis]MBF0606516.1 DUF2062 domain-containing protein [Nitrospirota bacterium]MBV6342475.1 DUF2062 domain-containing protein [Candidatus Magnetobacterium casensis]